MFISCFFASLFSNICVWALVIWLIKRNEKNKAKSRSAKEYFKNIKK